MALGAYRISTLSSRMILHTYMYYTQVCTLYIASLQILSKAAVVRLTQNEFIFLRVVQHLEEPHNVRVVQLLQDGYLSPYIVKRTLLFDLLHWSTTCRIVRKRGAGVSLSLSLSLSLSPSPSLFLSHRSCMQNINPTILISPST